MKESTDLAKKATKFWDWFETVSAELLLEPTRADLVTQLDNRINKLGGFDWEMGPLDGMYYLAISPNLDAAKLETTHEIISLSPKCEGWCFLSSKPPKQDWKGVWKMKNDFGKEISVDCSEWKYILYKFEDKDFDMDLMIGDIDGNLDTCYLAIDIALTGYLGEEEYMRLIKNVKIVAEFEEGDKPNLLKHIKKHIESIGS